MCVLMSIGLFDQRLAHKEYNKASSIDPEQQIDSLSCLCQELTYMEKKGLEMIWNK